MSEDLEQVTLTFPRALPQPRATVALHFNYSLSAALDGFFRSTYAGAGCRAASLGLSCQGRFRRSGLMW